MDERDKPLVGFVHRVLPWAVAAGALALYLVTLNHWVTIRSLPTVAQVAGWDWSPSLINPLHFVLTYPIRWLPHPTQPIALNIFTALCAVLTLGLLARSVSLLPQDRTREQRQRGRGAMGLLNISEAWLPPVFAALVCGLQLTFWEHATAATSEMLSLLLFAYSIRCLLEYRVAQEDRWLFRMAIVYGLGITNDWAMIGFLPLFVIALVWIKGLAAFEARFLVRMLGLGALGLLLYLLLPIVAFSHGGDGASLWDYLRVELGAQKNSLLYYPKGRVLILSLTSILPILVMGIRWPSSFGDTSVVGTMMTHVTFRVVHAMFLGACLWVSFDPKFSPRALGYGLPFLSFYYLGALSIGYFSGYFLLVCGKPSSSKAWHREKGLTKLTNRVVYTLVLLAFVGVPAALAYRNAPLMGANNSPHLRELSRSLSETLPKTNALVLSDDSYLLLLLQAGLAQAAGNPPAVPIDSRSLPYKSYHRHLEKHYPNRWPSTFAKNDTVEPIASEDLVRLLLEMSQTNRVFYLHPSFGYFFERFYTRPHGMHQELVRYPANTVAPPALTEADLRANMQWWSQATNHLASLTTWVAKKHTDSLVIGGWYSRAMNDWGVELQKLGRLKEAADCFAWAQALNKDNLPAVVNAKFNQSLQQAKSTSVTLSKTEEAMLGQYRTWEEVMVANGPFDEPEFCFKVGQQYAQGNNLRQAVLQFDRVLQLEPENLQARFWLGNTYLLTQEFNRVLDVVKEIRAKHAAQLTQTANQIELIRLEALARFGAGEFDQAEQSLLQAQKANPQDDTLLDTLFYIYFGSKRFTNVLATIDKQLALNPNNVRALLNKGATYIETKSFKEAVPPLDQVLKLQPENTAALRNRAIALLQSDQLDSAERDYQTLRKLYPNSHVVYYGLGEIAYRRKNASQALDYFRTFLKHAPKDTLEITNVEARMKELGGGAKP